MEVERALNSGWTLVFESEHGKAVAVAGIRGWSYIRWNMLWYWQDEKWFDVNDECDLLDVELLIRREHFECWFEIFRCVLDRCNSLEFSHSEYGARVPV